jgi:4-hydroxy-tetrahydrodipicolinate synthase
MVPPLFRGTGTALVTPFTPDGALDEAAFRRLIDFQLDGAVEALVVLGTTGENPTITPDERRRLIALALEQVNGRASVIVGTGTNSTRESIGFSKEAAAAGASGLLVVGPYYNKPTQAGFQAHVAAIAEATDCPIIVYNVPGRTGSNIKAETMVRIAEAIPTIVGVKEASGDLAQISDILAHKPAHLTVYAGDDELALPVIALGGEGVISVIANALPGPFSHLVRLALNGRFAEARHAHFELLAAMRACFFESNPIPIKTVLAEAGLIAESFRLPLVPIGPAQRTRVLEAFLPLLAAFPR